MSAGRTLPVPFVSLYLRLPLAQRVVLTVGAIVATLLALPALALTGPDLILFDNLEQMAAVVFAVLAIGISLRSATPEVRRLRVGVGMALILGFVGMATWATNPSGTLELSVLADSIFVAALLSLAFSIFPALFSGIDRRALYVLVIDAAIVYLAAIVAVVALWWVAVAQVGDIDDLAALVVAFGLVAGIATSFLALAAKRIELTFGGPWLVLSGLVGITVAWIAWLIVFANGEADHVFVTDFLFSAGALTTAYGALTWAPRVATDERYIARAERVADGLPIAAILISVVVALALVAPISPIGPLGVAFGTALVVVIAALRQAILLRRERRARAAEHRSAERLNREIRERANVVLSLSRLEMGATPHETAVNICREALRLDGIDTAVLMAYEQDGSFSTLAVEGIGAIPMSSPRPVRPKVAPPQIRSMTSPWVETTADVCDEPHGAMLARLGIIATASAPVRWNERVVGMLGLGVRDEEVARGLPERLATVQELAVLSAALLGPAIEERDRVEALRTEIRVTIETNAFRPVFQPVVDLGSGRVIGFEALTRFSDGTRPDVRFLEAASVGMALQLETACLRAALDASHDLPRDAWLSLNVSPELAVALAPLLSVLSGVEREIVLEITEHVAVADYERLTKALGTLREEVTVAVDDAGAGYAGLRHILELRPHYVKLDLVLVRSIDTDPARRAMVASMAAFARDTGATLIAEGIETDEELAELRKLGIALGQGYLLGRPASITEIAAHPRFVPAVQAAARAEMAASRGGAQTPVIAEHGAA